MDQAKSWALHEDAQNKMGPLALSNALEMQLPKQIFVPKYVASLGKKTAAEVNFIQSRMFEKHGENLPKILAVALHEYWFACFEGAAYIALCVENGSINNNETMRGMSTAKGYGDYEGWADTLSNGFSKVIPSAYRRNFIKIAMNDDLLDRESALLCMALQWFHEAEKLHAAGKTTLAFDALNEGYGAVQSAWHGLAWDEAYTIGLTEGRELNASEARTALAKKASYMAHVETRALKEEVRIYWSENIDPRQTNDDAASILVKHFPLRFRTLSGYVADFKKAPS